MTLLIVTPMHNEEQNIVLLARQLNESTVKPSLWVVVDDGSTDASVNSLESVHTDVRTVIVGRTNKGGLIGGSAFTAWQYGVDQGLQEIRAASYIMKLDADVELPRDYLERVLESFTSDHTVGVSGGILIETSDREQTVHVPGPVKLYSRVGYDALAKVPRAVGFDVMDEVAISAAGLHTVVRRDLPFRVRRPIGASQGLIHGRRRNGKVCKWTGYSVPYFFLHALRYAFRKPYIVGSIAMIVGYLRAGAGPYDSNLKKAHSRQQLQKLRRAFESPRTWYNEFYGVTR